MFRLKFRHRPKVVVDALEEHFASLALEELEVRTRSFPYRMRADLQHALNTLVPDAGEVQHFSGVRSVFAYDGLTFAELTTDDEHGEAAVIVPPEYEELDVGEDEPIRVLRNGLWLIHDGALPYGLLVSPVRDCGRTSGVQVSIAVPRGEKAAALCQRLFRQLEEAARRSRCYRGKVLSLEHDDRYTGEVSGVKVHKLPPISREQIILPEGTLELLERNVIDFVRRRSRLAELGYPVKKGVLFYGPPGVGKTHTIHYLASALAGHTTLLVTAEQVAILDEYMALARLLQPCVIVIEDVDLIARERKQIREAIVESLLNRLLNEMDGLREDAEIIFILTTNHPEALEQALAARPGRVDQAIEFPLPDEAGRQTLIRLYAWNTALTDDLVLTISRRTEGVSAAFIKELMRRATQFHLERGEDGDLSLEDIEAAMEELLFKGGPLNAKLLGGAAAKEAEDVASP